MTTKRTRPIEWLLGFWLLSVLGAAGAAGLAWRYASAPWLAVGLWFLCATLGCWASAGMLYHETGRTNDRWAKRLAAAGQVLSLIGVLAGLLVVVLELVTWLMNRT